MRQQGERPVDRHEDAWWRKLYDDSTGDTGPASAADSLDDRFASAAGTVGTGGLSSASVQDTVVEAEEAEEADGPGVVGGSEEPEPQVNLFEPPDRQIPRQVPRQDWWSDPRRDPRQAPFPEDQDPEDRDPRSDPQRSDPQDSDPRESPPQDAPVENAPPVDSPSPTDDLLSPSSNSPTPQPSSPPTPAPVKPVAPTPDPRRTNTPDHVGSAPPAYEPEPTALPPAEADDFDAVVPDTALDGARYGAWTLRAASVRGDSARYRGEPRRDALLTARFGAGDRALVLVAMATGARTAPQGHRAAADVCRWIARAVGRAHGRLTEDIRAARRGDLKAGLQRLTERSLGKVRAGAADLGVTPEEYGVEMLRCLLLPADPRCGTRVFFGVGSGGLFRLRDGEWQDIEPRVSDAADGAPVVGYGSPPAGEGDRLTLDLGITTPPSPYEPAPRTPHEPFRFRASVARPGDTLLLCGGGLAEPLREEPGLSRVLQGRWTGEAVPGLAAFLGDVQVRVKGYADDRTAAAVWED